MAVYIGQSGPETVIDHFREQGRLIYVDPSLPEETVKRRVIDLLEELSGEWTLFKDRG